MFWNNAMYTTSMMEQWAQLACGSGVGGYEGVVWCLLHADIVEGGCGVSLGVR